MEGGTSRVCAIRWPPIRQSCWRSRSLDPTRVVGHWESVPGAEPGHRAQALDSEPSTLRPASRFRWTAAPYAPQGSAPQHWVEKARALIAALPAGSPEVDLTALTDVQDPTFVRLRDAIQAHVITFDSNAPRPAPGQDSELDALAGELRELIQVAGDLGFSVRVMIVGHTDSTGNETANLSLSAARAEVVRSMLRARGIAPDLLLVRSAGTLEPLELSVGQRTGSIGA